MSSTLIHAVYEGGVFKPIEPVDLPEHCQVMVEPMSGQTEEVTTVEVDAFWVERSLDQLAADQGVHVVSDWREVFGSARELWENDESFEAFLGVA
jgi:predicted DNA-binding antitoxin AbrB/MazE fold protein